MAKTSEWFCVNEDCRRELGSVLGGEFTPAEDIGGRLLQTRGPNLVVTCPVCGTPKVWYTADPITRALYQLVDVTATQAARRMVSKASDLMLSKNTE